MEQISTPYSYYRGGTSKAAIVLRKDLPTTEDSELDAWILAVYGSPDRRQIDGIGGADILTSKFAVVGPSSRADADVDYSFFQVDIQNPRVMRNANCGNISAAIGPFAVDSGIVPAVEPVTHVRIHATNFGQIIHAAVPVRGGKAQVIGTQQIDGVPGQGAPISLDFRETVGGLTGKVLPTGNVVDRIQVAGLGPLEVTIVEVANLVCYVRAKDLGLTATEDPTELAANTALMAQCEQIRLAAIVAAGLAPNVRAAAESGLNTPLIALVGPPLDWRDYANGKARPALECDITARLVVRKNVHKTYPGTAGACLGVAAALPGAIPHQMTGARKPNVNDLRIGHPCGVLSVSTRVAVTANGQPLIQEASLIRTARRIADGHVYVPIDKLPWLAGRKDGI